MDTYYSRKTRDICADTVATFPSQTDWFVHDSRPSKLVCASDMISVKARWRIHPVMCRPVPCFCCSAPYRLMQDWDPKQCLPGSRACREHHHRAEPGRCCMKGPLVNPNQSIHRHGLQPCSLRCVFRAKQVLPNQNPPIVGLASCSSLETLCDGVIVPTWQISFEGIQIRRLNRVFCAYGP